MTTNDYPTFFESMINLAITNGSHSRSLLTSDRAIRLMSDWELSSAYNKHGVTADRNKAVITFTA